MPVRKIITPSGTARYQWGTSGKQYPTKKQAEQQGRAVYASGYKKKK